MGHRLATTMGVLVVAFMSASCVAFPPGGEGGLAMYAAADLSIVHGTGGIIVWLSPRQVGRSCARLGSARAQLNGMDMEVLQQGGGDTDDQGHTRCYATSLRAMVEDRFDDDATRTDEIRLTDGNAEIAIDVVDLLRSRGARVVDPDPQHVARGAVVTVEFLPSADVTQTGGASTFTHWGPAQRCGASMDTTHDVVLEPAGSNRATFSIPLDAPPGVGTVSLPAHARVSIPRCDGVAHCDAWVGQERTEAVPLVVE